MRLVVGISGSSGIVYGVRLLEVLRKVDGVETHLVLSPAARLNAVIEADMRPEAIEALADHVHGYKDIAASISSGSFKTEGMIVAPCSMKTLSAVVNSYSDNLLTRAADVVLKERRRLVLMVREAPLHVGHARLMHEAALMGAILFPPVPAFYTKPKTLDDIVDHSVGRVLDLFGVDAEIVKRWKGAKAAPED